MAAAAAVFSPSIHTLKCTHVKHFLSDNPPFKFLSNPSTLLSSISHRSYAIEPAFSSLSISWRTARVVSAAVAQDEAEVTTAPPVEEEAAADQTPDEVLEPPVINTKLYFGNLPYNVDSAQLAGIIQDFGNPELIEVLYDRDTGRSRGFAFVTMSSLEDCNTVIENLDGSQYMGRILRVNFSDKPKPKEPLYPETEHKLFVGNLSWSVTSESLAVAFQEYGNVVGARVLYDGETGKSRGYGFVCYSTKTEMDNALQSLNGVDLEGREIRISLAQGKKTYSP
ncbi:RNA-binding (RRM/RBD/RNP motifs) family protein [Euphorbia peplus]|nr:RNA-binding (RRM/RBD/RNP motifs) family protein [Euphorbia peplus]